MTKKPFIGSALASMKAKQSIIDMNLASASALGISSAKHSALYGKMATIESLGIGSLLESMKAQHSTLNMNLASASALGISSAKHSALYGKMATIESLGIGSLLESMKVQHSTLNMNLTSVASMTIASNSFASILSSQKNALLEASQTEMGLSVEDFDKITEENVIEACEGLSDCSKEDSFNDFFETLPFPVRYIILTLLLSLLMPVIQNVIANLVTPYVQSYIEEKVDFSQKVSMNQMKSIPRKIESVDVTGLRFISGDNVRLRRSASTSSEILDEMVLGQIVTVLSKKRNWVEIMYEYDNGELLTGWVFTRYTKRFHK